MDTLISKCKSAKKPLVVAGCVPQGSRDLKELEGVSIVGVQQIDRVVEVVEETLKGHEVRLLNRKTLPALDLPKVHFTYICCIIIQNFFSLWFLALFTILFSSLGIFFFLISSTLIIILLNYHVVSCNSILPSGEKEQVC